MNPDQIVGYVAADMCDSKASSEALDKAIHLVGKTPDYVFCVAGSSRPGEMLDLSNDIYERQMKINYLGTVYTVKDAVQRMVKNKMRGKIVMVSSVAGFVSFLGYSAYSPAKAALRGL